MEDRQRKLMAHREKLIELRNKEREEKMMRQSMQKF